ncbi:MULTISPECIES: hypothetical protein [unclassified Bradyrhizobium]|uniref:hypothetical protein n=1 Tax=unclassified Bradyrhizobium TaxID=2631580 RepID=UPI0024783DD2|nr:MULTISPECIES: hypothetical protein [unclassified Bradyrhizobium]WGR73080.1 hypothetical protein MTX24_09710 [Bradyrhizobium sp. ISRA426]WGR77918.1 hypothetical protein MTX21_34675 [Bradyrhizobium sp. ISRA430]WGR88320.1 hypothetical protein MTX25_09715 [Bradyrhizobium sp. ISRA432]
MVNQRIEFYHESNIERLKDLVTVVGSQAEAVRVNTGIVTELATAFSPLCKPDGHEGQGRSLVGQDRRGVVTEDSMNLRSILRKMRILYPFDVEEVDQAEAENALRDHDPR